MKWMYFVVFCASVVNRTHARPGPNEFTHNNSINTTEATPTVIPAIPAVFTKDDELMIRRTQDTDTGTIETITQTSPRVQSEVKPIQTQSEPIDLNTVSTGTLLVDEKRHLGVAVPVTMEEIEKELASQSSLRETSTSKDGISTWILLSGTSPTAAPEMSRSGAENQKVDKIAKIRDNSKAPNKAAVKSSQANNKIKPKPKTTTPLPSTINNSELNTSKIDILPEPVPLTQTPILKPKKKQTTTTITTTPQTPEEVTVTDITGDMISTTKETPVPFLVLEPKDADFDLPQDRSPGKTTTKKPKRNNNKTKKKNNKKPNNNSHLNDIKNSTKTAIKKKENPIGTKIYNYLSREMMPAVGLLGLVLTAGLAGYFVGPFGALRRSYDVADRKDDLYYYNNEEYAGTDGQYEEEVFGKVIAGMPLNTNYRNNVRYNHQRPNYYHQSPSKYPQQYNNRYRNTANQQFQQQQPAQQLSYSGYHPNTQNHAANYQRIHHAAPASQNVVSQKSISSPIFAIQPSSASTTVKSTLTTTLPATVVHEINKLPNKNVDDALQSADSMVDNPNELKRRTQFVVGSVVPETNVMDMNNDRDKTVVVPEHGPRRRRSVEGTAPNRKAVESDLKKLENSYDQLKKRVDSMEKNEHILKEMKHIDYEIGRLRKVIAEIKDIEQFQDELHIKGKNRFLSDTITSGVIHISEGIKFVNELLDNPIEIESKISNREAMMRTVNGEKPLNDTLQKKSDVSTSDTFEPTEPPSGIMSLLKILELKAAFGVNVLRSIRPAFDRAFQDVFHVPTQESEST
ncbi:uncharacterized protein LOC119083898 [Bradysia coprophila]|uniref:uncharacterized protein LOC119083898 n=1 Tax=Bradysia coprophila TaxID=38358 RepID=UPI00187DDA2E|nr:uncharacterized protein LOC119083898 [Bradysia coprophila]XP_037049606.1 uncharacterized protein LOC119083898 [Bradysia coprophila]